MHLVALTSWAAGRKLDDDVGWLAQLMGVSPYDARLRVNAGVPVILARRLALDVAQRSLATVRAHGHGAVVVDEASVPGPEQTLLASGFELHDQELIVRDRGGQRYRLPYAQLLAVVRAVEVSEQQNTVEKVEKKMALGLAVMSGGLIRSKTVRTTHTDKAVDHEQVAYVFRAEGPEPLQLRQSALSFDGLGAERLHSAHQNFVRLMAKLRALAPNALHDERLCARRRGADQYDVRVNSGEQTRTSSNAGANALAAYLLVHAHLQRQL